MFSMAAQPRISQEFGGQQFVGGQQAYAMQSIAQPRTMGAVSNMTTMAAPMQSIAQPRMQTMTSIGGGGGSAFARRGMTTMAAPIQSIAAPRMIQQAQAPLVEYVQPAVEYIQAPAVEYIQQARGLQERATVAPRNLLAMGNVVSERVITIEELASMDRYTAAEAVEVQAPREIVVHQPRVEYVQAAPAVDYIQQQPMVEYIQPQAVTMAPQMMTTMAPQTMTMAPQSMMMSAPMAYGAPMTTMAPQTFLR